MDTERTADMPGEVLRDDDPHEVVLAHVVVQLRQRLPARVIRRSLRTQRVPCPAICAFVSVVASCWRLIASRWRPREHQLLLQLRHSTGRVNA